MSPLFNVNVLKNDREYVKMKQFKTILNKYIVNYFVDLFAKTKQNKKPENP